MSREGSGCASIEAVVDFLEGASGLSGVYRILAADDIGVLRLEAGGGSSVVDLVVLTRLLEEALATDVRSGKELNLLVRKYESRSLLHL